MAIAEPGTDKEVVIPVAVLDHQRVEEAPDGCINAISCCDGFGVFAPSSIALLWSIPSLVVFLHCNILRNLLFV
jgi:hypothetical protein